MSIKFEAIPTKLNWTADGIARAVEDELNNVMKAARDDFKKTTRTWKTKVDFILMTAHLKNTDLEAATGTDNEIYGYVSRGTRAHIIRPRKARILRFKSQYRAKTIKRRLGSNAGGASGETVFSANVLHPGTQAREFEEEVADKYQKVLQKRLQDAITKAVRQ